MPDNEISLATLTRPMQIFESTIMATITPQHCQGYNTLVRTLFGKPFAYALRVCVFDLAWSKFYGVIIASILVTFDLERDAHLVRIMKCLFVLC